MPTSDDIFAAFMERRTQEISDAYGILRESRDDEALLAALGVPQDRRKDPVQVEVAAMRFAIAQTAAIFRSPVGAGLKDDLDRAGAGPALTIVATCSPEHVIRSIFENASAELAGSCFAEPGVAESVQPEQTTLSVRRFPDGSGFVEISRGEDSNHALRQALSSRAKTAGDLAKPHLANTLVDAFRSVALSTADKNPSKQALALIDEMANRAAMGLLLASGFGHSTMSMPASSLSEIVAATRPFCVAEGDANGVAWAQGVTVSVAGVDCPSPAHLPRALDPAAPLAPISLAEALARRAKANAPRPTLGPDTPPPTSARPPRR